MRRNMVKPYFGISLALRVPSYMHNSVLWRHLEDIAVLIWGCSYNNNGQNGVEDTRCEDEIKSVFRSVI
jgi:hypothetical protein